MAERLAMYIDTSKCMGCRGCQVACKQWNDLPASQTVNTGSYENPPSLAPNTWTRIKFREYDDGQRFQWLFLKEGCMHCSEAVCVDVCPTSALKYGEQGIITFERDLCNGCGYCSQFCPFHVPQLEVQNLLTGVAKSSKCVFCQDRVSNSLRPACVKTCPAGALAWANRDEVLDMARVRVEELKNGMGFPAAQIYGETQLGGLGRIYVLTAPPKAYDLPEDPKYPATATLWQKIIQPVGGVALTLTTLGALVVYLISRQHIEMEAVE